MNWATPDLLWLLLLLLPIGWGLRALLARRERQLRQLADEPALQAMLPNRDPARARRRAFLGWLAAALVLTALARPRWGFHWQEVTRRGLDILVVLDTSNSMLASDIKPTRLQQAQWGLRDLVRRLQGDRIGLLAFAGGSFLQCPLTIDYAAFLLTLDDLYAGIIPRGGTELAQALTKAIDSFDDREGADRVLLLITDGEDHGELPPALLDRLKKKNIRVYAVGVGSPEGSPIELSDERGGLGGYLKDPQGQVVHSRLNEEGLKQLALGTGGAYVRAAPGDFGVERLYREGMAALQRGDQTSRMAKVYEERFPWFLGAALALLVLEAAWPERRRANGARERGAATRTAKEAS